MNENRVQITITGDGTVARSAVRGVSDEFRQLGDTASQTVTVIDQNVGTLAGSINYVEAAVKALVAAMAIEKWTNFAKSVAEVNSEYEQMELKLLRLVDSANQLQNAMKWTRETSSRTLFGSDDLVDAVRTLLDQKMDPQRVMQTLSDAARGASTTVLTAAKTLTDAASGSFDQLKTNFGITAGVMEDDENRVVLKFRVMGEQMHLIADNTQQGIADAVLQVFARYQGASEAYFNSYKGILESFEKEWTLFKASVGEKDNLFLGIEGGLQALRSSLYQLKSDGVLDLIAEGFAGKIRSGIGIALDLVQALGNIGISVYERISSYGNIAQYGLLGYMVFGIQGAAVGALVAQYSGQASGLLTDLYDRTYALISSRPEIVEWGLVGFAVLGLKGAAIGALLGAFAPQVTAAATSLVDSATTVLSSLGIVDFGVIGYLVFGARGAMIASAAAMFAQYIAQTEFSAGSMVTSVTNILNWPGAITFGLIGALIFGFQGATVLSILGPAAQQVLNSTSDIFTAVNTALSSLSAAEYGLLGYVLFGVSGAVAGVIFKNILSEAKGSIEALLTFVQEHPILSGYLVGGLKGAAAGAYFGSRPSGPSLYNESGEPYGGLGGDQGKSTIDLAADAIRSAVNAFRSEQEADTGSSSLRDTFNSAMQGLRNGFNSGSGGPKVMSDAEKKYWAEWYGYKSGPGPAIDTGAGGAGADPFGMEQLRQKIHQIEADFRSMYREFHNSQYVFWQQEAESQGNFEQAAMLKNWQTYENSVANIAQQTAKARTDIEGLQAKLSTTRGVDPEAAAAIQQEIGRLQELVNLDNQRAEAAKRQFDLNNQINDRKKAVELAQVNVTYAQLTGSMEAQLKAQLALIDADAQEKLGIDWKTKNLSPLGEAYRRVYQEQERIAKLRLDGSFTDGMREAVRQMRDELPKQFDLGLSIMKSTFQGFSRDVGQGFGNLVDGILTGKIRTMADVWKATLDFMEKAFANAVSNMVSKLIESKLNELMVGGSGGGLLGFLGLGGGSGSGISGPASDAYVQPGWDMGGWMASPSFHSGGVAGQNESALRIVRSGIFANAPRFHSGLADDEIAAILQKGEVVIPRNKFRVSDGQGSNSDSDAVPPIVIHIAAMDGQSIYDFVRRNKQVLTEPILDSLKRRGPVRSAIKGAL